MTREEAIESLKRDIHNAKISGHQTFHYEMAINALEQQPSDDKVTITMDKGTLKYSGKGYVVYNKDWFRKHFATEVQIMTGYDGYIKKEPCEDCVSRQAVFETIDDCNSDGLKGIFCSYDDGEKFKEYIKKLPPVTPTKCIANIQFSKEDLKKICEERIEIAMKHGTCKDCKNFWCYEDCELITLCDKHVGMKVSKNFYCKDFKKRGNSDGSN